MPFKFNWRHILLAALVLGSLFAVFFLKKISQDEKYHDFADRRTFLGIPNCFDVLSNLPFLFAGIAGIRVCLRHKLDGVHRAWLAFFMGVALVFFGSSYYHWDPRSDSLVWDRLPMTVGFMGLFVALLGEAIHENLARVLLIPALLAGLSSVLYWYKYDDLRFYVWIQFAPLLCIPVILVLFRSRYTHQWLILSALGCYGVAKAFEALDRQIFEFTREAVSGHTLKHLFAALGCFSVFAMLNSRAPKGTEAK